MAQAERDENRVTTILGVSNADGVTPVVVWADPVTHRLLVDSVGTSSITFVDNEIPTGDIDGNNKDFVLANTPNPTPSLSVYVNGQRLKLTDDYTLATATISLATAPPTGSLIICDYRY